MGDSPFVTEIHGGLRYFDTRAAGEPLVLIHGLGNSLAFWIPVARMLTERRTIAVDLPGCGKSTRPQGWGPADLTNPINDLLEYLGAYPSTLVGHSLGGVVALHLAKESPAAARSLVLVDAHLFTASDILAGRESPFRHPRLSVALAAQFLGGLVPMKGPLPKVITSSAVSRSLFLWPFLNKPASDYGDRLCRALVGNAGGLNVLRALRLARTYDLRSTLHTIRCPIDIVWGADDRLIEDQDTQELVQHAPIRRLLRVAGAAHWVLLEQPDSVAEFIGKA